MAKKLTDTDIVTGKVRISFPHLFEAYSSLNGDAKYSALLLIPKDDEETVSLMKEAANNAAKEGAARLWSGKIPKNLRSPLRDGDEEKDTEEHPEYANCYFLNCSSKKKPTVVRSMGKGQFVEIGPDDIKAGNYVKVDLNFYAYDKAGNKGVGVGLNNVFKVKDGESLGGSGFSASSAFAGEEEEDDDDDSFLD